MANLSDHLTSAAEAAQIIERRVGLAADDEKEYNRLRTIAEQLDLETWVLKDYVTGDDQ